MKNRIKITIPLNPITKKNHQQIIFNKRTQRKMVVPSKQYRQYERDCAIFLKGDIPKGITQKVNVKAVYYMKTKRRVDLTNLHEALHDVLVKYCILEDDNCQIIHSTDGSRVLYDKTYPRTEVEIEFLEKEK